MACQSHTVLRLIRNEHNMCAVGIFMFTLLCVLGSLSCGGRAHCPSAGFCFHILNMFDNVQRELQCCSLRNDPGNNKTHEVLSIFSIDRMFDCGDDNELNINNSGKNVAIQLRYCRFINALIFSVPARTAVFLYTRPTINSMLRSALF